MKGCSKSGAYAQKLHAVCWPQTRNSKSQILVL
nr:MAG TPA: hypothetical protein [Bacteriophage sp.]